MPRAKPSLDPDAMTPARFRACLEELGISQRDLARVIGSATRLPGSWATGVHSVPPAIGRWLERCVKIKAKQVQLPPAPKDWRRRYPLELIGRDALERLGEKLK
jgi:hypothetical protein